MENCGVPSFGLVGLTYGLSVNFLVLQHVGARRKAVRTDIALEGLFASVCPDVSC